MCVRCLHHRTKHHSQWLHLIDNDDLTAPRDHRFPSGCRPGCVLTWRLDWGSTPGSPAPAGRCRIHVLRPQDACWHLLEASDLGGAHPTPSGSLPPGISWEHGPVQVLLVGSRSTFCPTKGRGGPRGWTPGVVRRPCRGLVRLRLGATSSRADSLFQTRLHLTLF